MAWPRLGVDQALDLCSEFGLIDDAIGGQLELAVIVDEHKRRSSAGPEPFPQFTALVLNLGESTGAGLLEERGKVCAGSLAADTDKPDLITKFCFDLCDRRAFTEAGGSPRSPEPNNKVLVCQAGQINGFARDGGGLAGQHRCVEDRAGGCRGGGLISLGTTGARKGGKRGENCNKP